MRARLCLSVFVAFLAIPSWSAGQPALAQPIVPPGPCAAGLVPDADLTIMTDQSRLAWLTLITVETYESAQQKVETSADIQFTDLFKIGNGKANYGQFNEKRLKFLQGQAEMHQLDRRVAYVRYTVPPEARNKYFDCIMKQSGLRVMFEAESREAATVAITFRSRPDDAIRLSKIDVTGGTADPGDIRTPLRLPHDGSHRFTVKRVDGQPEIRVVARAANGVASDAAVSVTPNAAVRETQPCIAKKLLPDRVAYFNANGRVRITGAELAIQKDCSAILSFTAAAMHVETIQGNDGPHVQFALTGPNGLLTTYTNTTIATVIACGGYQQHSVGLDASRAPKDKIAEATGFSLNMPGGSASKPCIR